MLEREMLEDFKRNGFELECWAAETEANTNKAAGSLEKDKKEKSAQNRVEASKSVRVFWLPEDFVCRASYSHDGFTIHSFRLLPFITLVPRDYKTVCEANGRTGLKDFQASQVEGPFSIAMAAEQRREVTVWKKDLNGKQILFGHQLPVLAVSWSPCGKMLASVAAKELVPDENKGCLTRKFDAIKNREIGEVIVWDLELEQPKFRTSILSSHVGHFLTSENEDKDEILQSLCWSTCGLYLAFGAYSSVLLLDAVTGKLLNMEKIVTGPRPFLAWGKAQGDDVGYLASGWMLAKKSERSDSSVKDGALKIWKMVRDKKCSKRLQAIECKMEEDPDRSCKCLDWSKSSYSELTLASITTTSDKLSIRLWRRSTGADGTWQSSPVAKISHQGSYFKISEILEPVWLAFQRDARLEGSKVEESRAGEKRVGKISLDRGDGTVDIVYEKLEKGCRVEQTECRVRLDSIRNRPTLVVSTLENVYRFQCK